MKKDEMLVALLNEAKENVDAADELIRTYMPFIKSETAKYLKRPVVEENDCELSIAMLAFYEAIQGYFPGRGAFFHYASVHIRSRLIDHTRKEKRHRGLVSLDQNGSDGSEASLADTLSDGENHAEEFSARDAAKREIEEFTKQLKDFGVSLSDVSEHCPYQQRTLNACKSALEYAKNNPDIIEDFLRLKRLPIARLAAGGNAERKTLERHRKYMVALLLAYTNGYEIIRGHIKLVFERSL